MENLAQSVCEFCDRLQLPSGRNLQLDKRDGDSRHRRDTAAKLLNDKRDR
jgi:hypothetical protein